MTGESGTLVIVDTRGLHHAAVLKAGERRVLWNYFSAVKNNTIDRSFLLRTKNLIKGLKAKAIRAICHLLSIYPIDIKVVKTYRFKGLKFRVHPINRYEKSRCDRMVAGTKEPETIQWIDDEFRSGDIFVDIGENIGNYSIYAALKHKGLKVFAFEPEPHSLIQLIKNVKLNELPIR